jgi:hypothetical protein
MGGRGLLSMRPHGRQLERTGVGAKMNTTDARLPNVANEHTREKFARQQGPFGDAGGGSSLRCGHSRIRLALSGDRYAS